MTRTAVLLVAVLAFGVSSTLRAEEAVRPSPADDLQALQGHWKVTTYIGGQQTSFGETPSVIQQLGNSQQPIQIQNVSLSLPGQDEKTQSLVLCNDLPLPDKAEQVGLSVRGDRLMLLALPTGKGLLASYNVKGDNLTLRYPAGCCSRSGNVISLQRVLK